MTAAGDRASTKRASTKRPRDAVRPAQRRALSRPTPKKPHEFALDRGLRSVALNVPDLAAAETVLHAGVAPGRRRIAKTMRSTCAAPVAITICWRCMPAGDRPQLRQVTLRARSAEALEASGRGRRRAPAAPSCRRSRRSRRTRQAAPASRSAIRTAGSLQVVHGDARPDGRGTPQADDPMRLAHVVLNSHAVDETKLFLEQALGFKLADRTGIMAFMNCNRDHHTHRARRRRQRRAEPHRLPDARRGIGDARRRPHEGRGLPRSSGAPAATARATTPSTTSSVPSASSSSTRPKSSRSTTATWRAGPTDWKWPPGRVDQWGISPPPGAAPEGGAARSLLRTRRIDCTSKESSHEIHHLPAQRRSRAWPSSTATT